MKYLERSFSVASGFGEGTKEKGRFIWDAAQKKLVRAEDYVPPTHALHAPIITDRWYEGATTLDGTDIGSRAKRNAYMQAKGLVDANDFSTAYFERERRSKEREAKAERRGAIQEMVRRHLSTPTVERTAPRGRYEE